ncbi:MAG: DUF4012 domain-containing protein [bacterium]|nr:DUF4012 domain-containing protein [bacterium]
MSSDFVFIDPNKIPPRRSVKPAKSGRFKVKKLSAKVWEKNYEEDIEFQDEVPEFNLLDGVLPENNNTVQAGYIDSLSQAIFMPERVSFGVVNNFVVPQQFIKHEAKTREDVRQELLAEIESIYAKDEELAKRINELSATSRAMPMQLVSASLLDEDIDDKGNLKIHIAPRQNFYKNFGEKTAAESGEPVIKKELAERYRAESDWFQVSLTAPSRVSDLKRYYENKNRRNFNTQALKSELPKKDSSFNLKSAIGYTSVFLVPMALVYLFVSGQFSVSSFASGGGDFVKTALGGVNSKLLSTSSFTLVNSKESEIFPQLTDFNSQIKEAGLGRELNDNIENFLQKNANFSWFNIFKNKPIGNVFSIIEIESLAKVKNALNTLSANNKSLVRLSVEFSNYTSIMSFWNQVLLPDKNYLIVVLNSERSWPGGGEPKNYVVVSTTKEGLETVSSGKFSELDAAFSLKVVPPDPIKITSTSWLPSQSFWFMDFRESAKTVTNFFENTSGKRIDGVIAVNENFLKDLSFKESLTLDTSLPSWFYGFYDALGRKPAGRWAFLASILNEGLSSHEVQFYFKDPVLEKFVEGSGWSTKTGDTIGKDSLGVSWASLKGGSLNLELSEYRAQIFQDGSVMARLNLMVRQNIGDESLNYLKVYLPKGFQVLKAEGFSAKEKIPEFSYATQGFSSDKRIGLFTASKIGNIDIFDEGDSGIIGGWLQLKRNERKTISLEYISAVKISRAEGANSYALKIIRPSQKENTPFRYIITPQEGVKITSLEPNGFVSENMGEYQGNLSQDLNLISSFLFKK